MHGWYQESMRIFFCLLLLLVPSAARATVFPIFSNSEEMVTLMLGAIGRDADAAGLYEALSADRKDEQGKWTKKVALVDAAGVKAFSAVCVFSKVVDQSGSCTVIFRGTQGMRIDKKNKTVSYELADSADAKQLASFFVIPAQSGDFYRSTNGNFVIGAERDSQGQVRRIYFNYR